LKHQAKRFGRAGFSGIDTELDQEDWFDAVQSAHSPLELGSLGPYRLLREVGRGGQGVVYEAQHETTNDRFALKRLASGSFATPLTLQRFEREMEAVSRLDHPLIVRPHALKVIDGQPVLIMEWIEGRPLQNWIETPASHSLAETVATLHDLSDAIAHAHRRGVIHRDIKPQNVLVDQAGRPHILDFGLAKWSEFRDENTLTATSQFLGTPAYASPEQTGADPRGIDVRSDIYSFGVLSYHLLTGTMPYPTSGGLRSILEHIATTEPKRPRAIASRVTPELEAILLRMLEKDPNDRYPSMDAVNADLGRAMRNEPVEARIDSGFYLLQKLASKHRIPIALGTAFLFLLTTFAIVMTLLYRRVDEEARTATRVEEFLASVLSPGGAFMGPGEVRLTDLLDSASARLEGEFADDPAIAARLHHRIAASYASLWMWEATLIHATAAGKHYEEMGKSHRLDHARALALRGVATTFQDDPAAIEILEQSLRVHQELLPADDERQASALSNLAFACWRVAQPPQYDRAESLYEEALATYEASGQPPSVLSAGTWFSYAAMAGERGELEKSIERYQHALGIYDLLPAAFQGFARACREDYARTLASQGKKEEAESQLARAHAGREEDAQMISAREDVATLLAGSLSR